MYRTGKCGDRVTKKWGHHTNNACMLHVCQHFNGAIFQFSSLLARRKALAWGAFWKLERLWRSSELPISTKIKLFHTTCVTILLYGCESWVLSQLMECKINAFATSSYRVMLNIKRRDHVSNTIIYSMTDTQPLVHCVKKWQLSFLGHVLRLSEEEPVRRYYLYIPPHGKRRPGRPRTSYQSYIKRLLRYDEDDMSADQIATLAQDRCAWRNLVIACSAAEGWWWWWWWVYLHTHILPQTENSTFKPCLNTFISNSLSEI